jgi:hypothetical protein
MNVPHQLKLLQPAKPKLGLYLRPGRNDHTVFQQLLAEDRAVSGLVMDARHLGRHRQLREELALNGVHAVLDPNVMQMSTPGGSVLAGLDELPWTQFGSAGPRELRGKAGRQLATAIAEVVEELGFSAVLAPAHLIEGGSDPMFAADRAVAGHLRRELDRRGLRETCIFYPLALPASALRDQVQRTLLMEGLAATDIDAVWLRVHPFGTTSAGPIALRRYIETAWALQRMGRPLVAEHSGTVGLALMAFGAVGGIESGITLGERFDAQALQRPPDPSTPPFSPAPRVYLHEIGAFVSRASATKLFRSRQMVASLACRDPRCCRTGVEAMVRDPRRHFVLRRIAEVDRIGGTAPEARATVYLHNMLQPAALLAVRAARVLPELEVAQRRLDAWSLTLDAIARSGRLPNPAPALGYRVGVARPVPKSLD